MCGIIGIHFRESVRTDILDILFSYAEKRGQDETGILIIKKNEIREFKYFGSYSKNKDDVLNDIEVSIDLNDILIATCRAIPETEGPAINEENMQPIWNDVHRLAIAHNGAVASQVDSFHRENNIIKDNSYYNYKTNIDSETILASYLYNKKDLKKVMETDLIGGFAFILYDQIQNRLKWVVSHQPLSQGYIRGLGFILHSNLDAIIEVIKKIRKVTRMGVMAWEDFYAHITSSFSILEMDLDSGFISKDSYTPLYYLPQYDFKTFNKKESEKEYILVACSGGLDSTTALMIAKESDMTPIAVHFSYGHRGQSAEKIAIQNITKLLDVPLIEFNFEDNMKVLDSGMLTDKNAPIISGTKKGCKTTAAWTNCRNMFFMTYMIAYAEKLILEKQLTHLYITAGFLQLSEEGGFPDNSLRFFDSMLNAATFGSLVGKRIRPVYGMANILKAEQYVLLDSFSWLEKLSPWLVSCDRPVVINGIPCNCSLDNGEAGCGSGRRSMFAIRNAGLKDLRNYYVVNDSNYDPYMSKGVVKQVAKSKDIIDRILIPDKNLQILKRKV